MQLTQKTEMPANQVTALFADAAVSFVLANGATFADLADRLNHLDARHSGLPKAISCKFGTAQQAVLHPQPRR